MVTKVGAVAFDHRKKKLLLQYTEEVVLFSKAQGKGKIFQVSQLALPIAEVLNLTA